jgi:hypothetical protein
MRLSFDTIDEVKDFVKQLKGTRGGKGGSDDDTGATAGNVNVGGAPAGLAPPPAQPPAGAPAFTPPAGGAFVPNQAPAPSTMAAIVGRITAQVDKLIAGQVPGQPAQPMDAVLQWLRGQIAPHDASAAAATMDQVKQVYLNKLPEAALTEMARQIGA